jgi:hypothetical protein
MKVGAIGHSTAAVTKGMMIGGSAFALVMFAVNIKTSRAQNSPQTRQEIAGNECAQRAFTSYVTASNSLLQQQGAAPLQSVEMTIARRRLQEQYCLQFARYLFPDPTNQGASSAVHSYFRFVPA